MTTIFYSPDMVVLKLQEDIFYFILLTIEFQLLKLLANFDTMWKLNGPFIPEIIPQNGLMAVPLASLPLAPSSTKIRLLKNSDDEPNRFKKNYRCLNYIKFATLQTNQTALTLLFSGLPKSISSINCIEDHVDVIRNPSNILRNSFLRQYRTVPPSAPDSITLLYPLKMTTIIYPSPSQIQ